MFGISHMLLKLNMLPNYKDFNGACQYYFRAMYTWANNRVQKFSQATHGIEEDFTPKFLECSIEFFLNQSI